MDLEKRIERLESLLKNIDYFQVPATPLIVNHSHQIEALTEDYANRISKITGVPFQQVIASIEKSISDLERTSGPRDN